MNEDFISIAIAIKTIISPVWLLVITGLIILWKMIKHYWKR